jgi:hypothetical protein
LCFKGNYDNQLRIHPHSRRYRIPDLPVQKDTMGGGFGWSGGGIGHYGGAVVTAPKFINGDPMPDEVMPKKHVDPNAWVRAIVDRMIDGDVGVHDAMTEIVEGLPPLLGDGS